MSRIGKLPVTVPDSVKVAVTGNRIEVSGPKGSREFTVSDEVSVRVEGNQIHCRPRGNSKAARQHWGMSRTMVQNCVEGVSAGFRRELEISGVGYRAQMRGKTLSLALGLSHDVLYEPPEGITITAPSATSIVVEGCDKQKVGQTAAEIRKWRPPEPFKGKGIRHAGEFVYRKVGKKK